jgi:hypothetical protein
MARRSPRVPVSAAVRRYYAERIFARSGRDSAPPNFRPLERPATGTSSVEGCRGGGKNVLEVALLGQGDRIEDLRLSCGLCNPAMYAGADVVAEWAKGKTFEEVLALDPRDVAGLEPFFQALGGPGKPDDAREKFQYAVAAVQNAVRDHLKRPAVEVPPFDEPTDRDWETES